MNDDDIDYLFDLLEDLNKRLIRTESKLSALMNHMKLSTKGEPIEPTYSGHRKNPGLGTTGLTQGRPSQRRGVA